MYFKSLYVIAYTILLKVLMTYQLQNTIKPQTLRHKEIGIGMFLWLFSLFVELAGFVSLSFIFLIKTAEVIINYYL